MTLWYLVVRLLLCTVLTVGMWWMGILKFHYPMDSGGAIGTISSIFITGALWALIFGSALTHWIGEKLGNFFTFAGTSFELKPQYSIAEARIQEGKYHEAIEAFRMYAAQYPSEVYPHYRVAELHLQISKNVQAAIEELHLGLKKANSPEALSLIHFRLADLHLEHGNNVQAALFSLREIQRCHPQSPQAKAALERARKLLEKQEIA